MSLAFTPRQPPRKGGGPLIHYGGLRQGCCALRVRSGMRFPAFFARSPLNTHEAERQIWTAPHLEWKVAWRIVGLAVTHFGKVPQVPEDYRQTMERVTGFRAPYIEDVIAFCVKGGLTLPGSNGAPGKPIPVPEWVLQDREVAMPVAITREMDLPTKSSPGEVQTGFAFTVNETRQKVTLVRASRR